MICGFANVTLVTLVTLVTVVPQDLMMMRNRDAYRVYLLIEVATSLFFFIIATVNSVYQVEVAKLNPLQLVLMGTVLEGTTFCLPGPYLARG